MLQGMCLIRVGGGIQENTGFVHGQQSLWIELFPQTDIGATFDNCSFTGKYHNSNCAGYEYLQSWSLCSSKTTVGENAHKHEAALERIRAAKVKLNNKKREFHTVNMIYQGEISRYTNTPQKV